MQSLDSSLVDNTLPFLAHQSLDFLTGLVDDFFDTRGVNASILEQLIERDPRHLAANGVMTRKCHSFRCIIDDDVNTGDLFEGANVASFPTNNAAFQLLRGQWYRRNGDLGDVVGGEPLNCHTNDLPGALIRFLFGLSLDLANQLGRIFTRLTFDTLEDKAARRFLTQSGDTLEFGDLGMLEIFRLAMEAFDLSLALDDLSLATLEIVQFAINFFLASSEPLFSLLITALGLMNALFLLWPRLTKCPKFGFRFGASLQRLGLGLDHKVLGLGLRLFENQLRFGFRLTPPFFIMRTDNPVRQCRACQQSHDCRKHHVNRRGRHVESSCFIFNC